MSSLAQIVNSAEIFYTRLASRTKRVAAKSIAAIPAESIPFIGVAVLIVDTGYELYAACETVRDLGQLYVELEMEGEVLDDAMHSVCDPELPEPGEVWMRLTERASSVNISAITTSTELILGGVAVLQ
jgi:hypothetical protein